mgnify:CR=1 FL=1
MKNLFYAIILPLLFMAYSASAQEQGTEKMGYGAGWRYAFSKEGRKEWKPEFTLRYMSGFTTSAPIITGGVRIDEKRTFSLLVGRGDTYIDHAPGDIYTIMTGVAFRRYFHLGKRKIFAIYSDLYIGAGWIDKVTGKYYKNTATDEEKDYSVIGTFTADTIEGICVVRCYKNLHLFLGPTIASDCFGFHVGVGF